MSKNEEKKAAVPPPRVRRGTKLNLDAGDRGMASPVVYRTDGRKTDFGPGERIPKVGHVPMLMPREKRDRSIGEASLAERPARSNDVPSDDFWAKVERTPIVPGPIPDFHHTPN